ncbi:MAG: transglutaminase, partial [Croceibacter sp.]|nr:transglutaminase [Croceibacter sp.]
PLEFDGYTNSYLQQYNTQGDLFMEYLEDYGHFNDVPLKFMIENLKTHYPHIFKTETHITEFKI